MSELSEGFPDLDTRLAEIDRRLREIQADLDPGREPRPTSEPRETSEPHPPPEPARPRGRSGPLAAALQRATRARPAAERAHERTAERTEELDAVAELHARLLGWIGELLDAYQTALAGLPQPTRAATGDELTISVGPFAGTEAVRAFERALSEIPGVTEVTIRGYEGENRAIVDVQLSEPTS
jgi:hypothetical protein